MGNLACRLMQCQYCLNVLAPDAILCPRCGSRPVAEKNPVQQHARPDDEDTAELPVLRTPKLWRKRAPWLLVTAVAAIGIVGYFLLYRPAAVRAQAADDVRMALTAIGASRVIVAIDRQGVLRLSGSVQGEDQHKAVLNVVRERPQFAKPIDNIAILSTANDIERRIARALESKWLAQFSVSIGPDFEAKLLGDADSEQQRGEVLAFVRAQPGVERVRDATSKSLDWRRQELQEFIDARRWRFVRGTVRDDGTILLAGIVASANDRALVLGATRDAFPGAAIQSDMVIWTAPVRRTNTR